MRPDRALSERINRGRVIPSPRLRDGLFALVIGGILAYGAGFAWYMLARLDLVNMVRDVNT